MQFHILSLFPETIEPYLSSSVIGRAMQKKIVSIQGYNIRTWAHDKHKTVDDAPFGGGPGMVLKVQPLYEGVQSILKTIQKKSSSTKKPKIRTILFSTRGKTFTQKEAKRLARYDHLILICGRYEGVDERVAQNIADEEISIGDFVLSGGELPAMVVIDAVARTIPGVLGKTESLEDIKGSYPVYTRPEIFYPEKTNKRKKWNVPSALTSGDHKRIAEWRKLHGKS